LGLDATVKDVEELMSEHSVEDTNAIDFPTFLSLVADKLQDKNQEEEVELMFSLFDESGKGFITVSDLKKIALELGENLTDDDLREMVQEAQGDENQGRVTLQDFTRMMQQCGLTK